MGSKFDDQSRIDSLREMEILDTEAEQCFDDITSLASTICGAPISLISLVDENRQWFKSKVGLDINETPLDVAFCKYAIREENYLLVHDPLTDERFKHNPLVTDGLKIRFYAGIPLRAKSGITVGTLCIIDTKPRDLTSDQLQSLMKLARQAEHLLSLRVEKKLHLNTLADLKRSQDWSLMIFNNSTDMMGIVKVDEKNQWPLQSVNPSFCKFTKRKYEDVVMRPVKESISPALLEQTLFIFKRVVATKKSLEFESNSVMENEIHFYETIISPKFNEQGEVTHLLIIARDISERKKNEALISQQHMAIAKTSKFSELGELAGSMAHEINNPLTIIISRSSKLKNMMLKNEFDHELFLKGITQVNETSLRIAKIIRSLKTISRNADLDPMSNVNLQSVIEDAQFLCEERLKSSDINLVVDYPTNMSLEIDARETQLTQVLINLLNNSVYAISHLEEKWIKVAITQSFKGDNLIVRVTDSGSGISPALQKKIMEPFFTTKEFGKGTGLGLSISKGIIESHSGKFYYDTGATNTTFVIEIPKRQKVDAKISA